MQQAKISVQDICCIALMAAVTVVMAQISIPMPMGVPMTMQDVYKRQGIRRNKRWLRYIREHLD